MTAEPTGFHFSDDRPAANNATLIVRIPAKLNRKRRLLAEFARQLRLPNYFGWNWDAFEECLRDLTWLDGIQEVVVVHRDVPFTASQEQRAIYLSILKDRMDWKHTGCPRFRVEFPDSSRSDVQRALNGSPSDGETCP